MRITERMHALVPALSGEQCEQFQIYYERLIDWNSRMNLTAITDPEDVATKHFQDSLAAMPYLSAGAKCIDVGTGAGFPGVPLLIARPDLSVTLLDSLNKRLVFLDALLEELGLRKQTELVHMRAEDAGRDQKYREQYDFALSRAVAGLSVLMELTVPFLKVGGTSICYKGEPKEEIETAANAADKLHSSISCISVPSQYGVRTLVMIKKEQRTAAAYPRKAGTPAKKPL